MHPNPLIIANWKMKLLPDEATAAARSLVMCVKKYTKKLAGTTLVVCPSHESIAQCAGIFRKSRTGIELGAQNCFWEERGAFTGEVSLAALARLGCTYCIVGHSERRTILRETDSMVQKKVHHIFSSSAVTPILCVGENKKERREKKVKAVLRRQLKSALVSTSLNRALVIAYEPVWAIGTGKPISPADCKEQIDFIRMVCRDMGISKKNLKVIYGGSVTHDTISSFVGGGVSDGALIGGASSNSAEFHSLLRVLSRTI
ncbi:MAG: triose-phosphate isomerase [Candidatus Uhrbacteria bacterium]|nr:triose-phosphate isomerase [Candidatus Uhrbacteria bacterium]